MNKNQKKWLVISIVIIIILALGLGLGLGLGLKKQDTHDYFNENFNNAFDNIYSNKAWGSGSVNGGSSGSGSEPKYNKEYIKFLQKFLKEKNIKSVVDIGCGDWQINSNVNFNNIDYKGYDVAESVIKHNTNKYKKSNINFYHTDLNKKIIYPDADLIICKDVLQHLSFKKINDIVSQFNKFKYKIIINDISDIKNNDIDDGGYRSLDITQFPFNIKNIKHKLKLWEKEPIKTMYIL